MEYTKGKWKVGKTPPLSNWVVGVNLGDPMEQNVVANLYDNEADAHLIAAAPDSHEATMEYHELLKLLPSVVGIFSKPEVKDHIPFGLTEQLWEFIKSDKARLALAKVEGA